MSFKIIFLCLEAMFIQNVYSQLNSFEAVPNPGFTNMGVYNSYDPMAGFAPSPGLPYTPGANIPGNNPAYITTDANMASNTAQYIATGGMMPNPGSYMPTGASIPPNPTPYVPTGANYLPMGANVALAPGENVVPGIGRPMTELDVYGGTGMGDIVVVGEMPVDGTTLITGQVPILGSVRFGGDILARGVISMSGTCGCGCGLNNVVPTYT